MFWLELWAMLQVIGMLISIAIFLIFFVYIGYLQLRIYLQQVRCKHEKYRENMACHAICTACGKDLGFIGNVRNKDKSGSEV